MPCPGRRLRRQHPRCTASAASLRHGRLGFDPGSHSSLVRTSHCIMTCNLNLSPAFSPPSCWGHHVRFLKSYRPERMNKSEVSTKATNYDVRGLSSFRPCC